MRTWPEVKAETHKVMARNRYRRAVELVRALDQHRLMSRLGRNTVTDNYSVIAAHHDYRRASGNQGP